jgi:hypothetical protein
MTLKLFHLKMVGHLARPIIEVQYHKPVKTTKTVAQTSVATNEQTKVHTAEISAYLASLF